MGNPDVIIAGAGLAGLSCARTLHRAGLRPLLLEASDAAGGRVRTDRVDGFLLDRGFQVFLTAYPECGKVWDLAALDLRAFEPGARIRRGGRFHTVTDPWRQPLRALTTALSPIGSLADKLKVARLRSRALRGTVAELFARPEEPAGVRLRRLGFSEAMVQSFFRPFFGGIFLESGLETSSRMMEFVFRMMAQGEVALPAGGMGRLSEALAAQLPAGAVRVDAPVARVQARSVALESGERLEAGCVVVATEGPAAAKLLPSLAVAPGRPVSCLYFAAPEPPVRGARLLLDGEGRGQVNNVAVLTEVAPEYAPAGQSLISVTVLGAQTPSESAVRAELGAWFGAAVGGWRHLRTYRIAHALPAQAHLEPGAAVTPDGVFVCGDYLQHGSIEGAIVSGQRTANAVLAQRGVSSRAGGAL